MCNSATMWRTFVILFAVFSVGLCRSAESDQTGKDILHVVDLTAAGTTEDAGSRIIGGSFTNIEKYPYTVQVLRNSQLSCGGSLLTTKTVLSAAHCFFDERGVLINRRDFSIRAGSSILSSGGRTSSVSKIITHELYNNPVRDNDIAVLVLSSRMRLGGSVGLALIPSQGAIVPDNATVAYVGWGQTNTAFPTVSTTLQEVSVYTVNRQVCASNYAFLEPILQQPFPVTFNMICAGVLGVGGRDACQGDSGGPMVYNGVVVGVISWGYGCAEPHHPGVSARVASYTQWINRTVTANGVGAIQVNAFILLAALVSLLRLS